MAFDYRRFVQTAFESLGPDNPLTKLGERERTMLVSLARVADGKSVRAFKELEQIGRVAREADALASKLHSIVFGGQYGALLAPFLRGSEGLPLQLEQFSTQLRRTVESLGKAGQKGKVSRSQRIVMASEYVRLTTGAYNDEHFAELLQAVNGIDNDEINEFSGDAIHKRREHLNKKYPELYEHTLRRARGYVESATSAKGID